jgi:hypothetical protein
MTSGDGMQPAPSVSNRRALGCLLILAVGAVVGIVGLVALPGSEARAARRAIYPGMSVEQVIERAEGWNSCSVIAGPVAEPIKEVRVVAKAFLVTGEKDGRGFTTSSEMAKALAAEMGQVNSEWRMTLGYLTLLPKRIYFDVTFSREGRVVSVSETSWGRLN